MEASEVFNSLKNIMQDYEKYLVCISDESEEYYLNTKHVMKNKKPLGFGGAKINKNYVSYHLMPIYVEPALLKNISPDLKRRMQGKSCFNFRSIDQKIIAELDALTRVGYQYYVDKKYVGETTSC